VPTLDAAFFATDGSTNKAAIVSAYDATVFTADITTKLATNGSTYISTIIATE